MKNKKTLMFIYFIGAISAYITAALNFIGGHNTSLGVIWLCLGSAMLCFGSIELNKMNKILPENMGSIIMDYLTEQMILSSSAKNLFRDI